MKKPFLFLENDEVNSISFGSRARLNQTQIGLEMYHFKVRNHCFVSKKMFAVNLFK